jgi:UDP-N-acetylmuramyl pentapeptide phosphotransferase/UDP-N-acetylglucosamine-1-phosphate transferase
MRLDIVDVQGGEDHERNTPLRGGLAIILAFNASLFAK